jgi:hypothetical protein
LLAPINLPAGLQEADLDSQTRIAVAAAATLVQVANPETLVEIVERGPQEFFRQASSDQGYRKQNFDRAHYDLIYNILASHVGQNLMEPGVG